MKKIYISSVILGLVLLGSCSEDFLDKQPQGTLSSQQLNSREGVEAVLVAAYSTLNGQIDNATNAFNSPPTNWNFSDIVSDDTHKGGGGVGDQAGMHNMEIFATNPAILDIERKWRAGYEGIARANAAIRAIGAFEGYDESTRNIRLGEARFLRGHYYFDLKKIYNQIPWVDEQLRNIDQYQISNTELSSEQLWQKIADDFAFAASVLPDRQPEVGRATKGAAHAYLCKTYIFQGKWNEAITAADAVINSGRYDLHTNYYDNFNPATENGIESVFAVQHSINDGAPSNFNGSIGERLHPPGGPHYPVYGFNQPTQNLVNAYKTDASGLPATDGTDVQATDYVDPRLDFVAGRPGIPFLDLGDYAASWARDIGTYGPYGIKKRVVSSKSQEHYVSQWPYVNSLNYDFIRYVDVLLWKAEALIETGDLEGARLLVNRIRQRARDGAKVTRANGQEAASYAVSEYTTPWTDATSARNALRLERRLEFACEGHRFFDLVRWGIADSVLNAYIARERDRRTFLRNAVFVKGKHEYFPVPQSQIDVSGGTLKQNPGYEQ